MADTLPTSVSYTGKGRYYWELIFSYDNSDNEGTLTDKTTVTKRTRVDSKSFMSNKFNVSSGFKYNNETSASVKYEGLGEASEKSSFSYHLDLAYELVKSSETATSVDTEVKTERSYTVGARSKLNMYRLCYECEGSSIATDIVATQPQDDVRVDLKFVCQKRILGLGDILNLFGHTFPGSSNTLEWASIRNDIVKNSDKDALTQFQAFVANLKTITPGDDNKNEWAAIRTTCQEIEDAWETTDKQRLFIKLLTRFSNTNPARDNRDEWQRIRDLSNNIVTNTSQVF